MFCSPQRKQLTSYNADNANENNFSFIHKFKLELVFQYLYIGEQL